MFKVWCAFVALSVALLLGQASLGPSHYHHTSTSLQRLAPAQVSPSLAEAFDGS